MPGHIHHDELDARARQGMMRILKSGMYQLEVTDADGREVAAGGRRLVNFATCCYLGLDGDISEQDVKLVREWGLRNGWSRITGTTLLSLELERSLAASLGLQQVRLAQSVSLINMHITALLGRDFPLILVDADAHFTLKAGLKLAPHRQVRYWEHNNLEDLELKLSKYPSFRPKLVVVDGVYSMKGSRAPIEQLLDLCHRHDGYLLIDDAHGFGVLGRRGFGVIDGLAEKDLQRVIYVASFAKCASNPVAFVGFPGSLTESFDAGAPFLSFCGPPSNLHVAIASRQLSSFPSSDYARRRAIIAEYSTRVHDALGRDGVRLFSTPPGPIVAVRIRADCLEQITAGILSCGILSKPVVYPVTRSGEEVIRFSLTAGHSKAQG